MERSTKGTKKISWSIGPTGPNERRRSSTKRQSEESVYSLPLPVAAATSRKGRREEGTKKLASAYTTRDGVACMLPLHNALRTALTRIDSSNYPCPTIFSFFFSFISFFSVSLSLSRLFFFLFFAMQRYIASKRMQCIDPLGKRTWI